MAPEAERLDAALKALHGTGRPASLAALHAQAAAHLPDPQARRFHLTHAWIFALEAGGTEAERLEGELRACGGFGESR